jgi:hypothetical protein
MSRLHRNTITYWVFLATAVAVSICSVWFVVWGLSISISGRIDGGLSLSVIVTCLILLWAGVIGAFDMALWKFRTLPADVTIFGDQERKLPRWRGGGSESPGMRCCLSLGCCSRPH